MPGYCEQVAGFYTWRNAALTAVKAIALTEHHEIKRPA